MFLMLVVMMASGIAGVQTADSGKDGNDGGEDAPPITATC